MFEERKKYRNCLDQVDALAASLMGRNRIGPSLDSMEPCRIAQRELLQTVGTRPYVYD